MFQKIISASVREGPCDSTLGGGTCDSTSGGHVTACRERCLRSFNIEMCKETLSSKVTVKFRYILKGNVNTNVKGSWSTECKRNFKIEV